MRPRLLFVVCILMMAMLACNLPMVPSTAAGTVTPTGALDILTLAAQTALAGQTQPAVTLTPAATTQAASAATNPGPPTNTSLPPTNTPRPCDQASFIQDVTIPDGTNMAIGQAFTKTWRLKNVGTCTWNTSYAMIFSGGDSLGAPAVINLPGSVPPNSTVDLSIDMKAPTKPGSYISHWKLRNSTGGTFGVEGNGLFFVKIQVVAPTSTPTVTPTITFTRTITFTPVITLTPTVTPPQGSGVIYDFAANLCAAKWQSQSGVLTCPFTSGDSRGYALLLQSPKLENGATETNPVMLTVPDATKTGVIVGSYPAIAIQAGYRFQAGLGCVQGSTQCSVIYQVNYVVNNGQPANLGQFTHTYDGTIQPVDIDLSALAGQPVQIVLVVLANGSSEGDQAVWIYPRIVKP